LSNLEQIWSKLAPRERWLVVGVAVAVVLFLIMTVIVRAKSHLEDLNDEIALLESDLERCVRLEARRVNVEQAYSKVAEQHSSEWTEAEIHNRLRQEIYRLARLDPDAPAQGQKNLVEIPLLRQGELRDSGDGYREYRLSVNIPPAPIDSLMEFLVRLQESSQSLRIDELELARAPQGREVGARLDVTRTVVDGVKGESGAQNSEPQRAETWDGSNIDQWKAEGCDIKIVGLMNDTVADGGCLKAVAKTAGATFYMTADLYEPGVYEVEIEAIATGAAEIRVRNESTGQFMQGSATMSGDTALYRYRLSFNAGATENGPLRFALPHVTVADAGTEVYVGSVTLRKVSG